MRWNSGFLSRRNHGRHERRVVPDSTAAASVEAQQEARKGTAAADPVIGVTPEGQTLAGAVVDGEFVESVDHIETTAPDPAEHAERDVAAGILPGENENTKHTWWAGRVGDPDRE